MLSETANVRAAIQVVFMVREKKPSSVRCVMASERVSRELAREVCGRVTIFESFEANLFFLRKRTK